MARLMGELVLLCPGATSLVMFVHMCGGVLQILQQLAGYVAMVVHVGDKCYTVTVVCCMLQDGKCLR